MKGSDVRGRFVMQNETCESAVVIECREIFLI